MLFAEAISRPYSQLVYPSGQFFDRRFSLNNIGVDNLISFISELITYLGSLASLAALAFVFHDPKKAISAQDSAQFSLSVAVD